MLTPHLVEAPTEGIGLLIENLFLLAQAHRASAAGSRGDHDQALEGFEAVRERHRLRLAQNPQDPSAQLALASANADVALALYMLGDAEFAADEYEPYIERLEEMRRTNPEDAGVTFERLRRGIPFVEILIEAGRVDDAIDQALFALDLCDEVRHQDTADASLPRFRTTLVYDLGWAHQARAEEAMEAGEDPRSESVRADLRAALDHLRSARVQFRSASAAGQMSAAASEERIVGRIEAVQRLLGER